MNSDKDKNDVIIGKDGILFLKNGAHSQMDYLIGAKTPLPQSVKHFKKNILNRMVFCKKRNIQYVHVVFPSKPLVMNQYLPDEFLPLKSLYETYYDIDESSIVYPLNALNMEEKKHSTFLKLDTHNNARGMVVILNVLLDKINIDRVKLSEVSKEEEHKGDLSIMLKGDSLSKSDLLHELMPIYNKENVFSNRNDIVGNDGMVVITVNHKAKNNKKILIFGDSFFLGIVALLSNIFKEVLFIRSATFYKEYVKYFKPDIIFTGNAERYLPSTKLENINDSHMNKVLSKSYNKRFMEKFRSHLLVKSHKISTLDKNNDFKKYKKISFPLNVYAFLTYFVTGAFRELHYGLFDTPNDDLIQAQKNSTDLLFKYLYKSPAKILEVGIGLGTTHQKLINKGFICTGITPDQAQIDIVQEQIQDDNLICTTLENFSMPAEKFDILLFQESAQYIAPDDIFAKANKLLTENGRILIVDEFSIGVKQLHDIDKFKAKAKEYGFMILSSIDLSNKAEPTEEVILRGLKKFKSRFMETLNLTNEQIDHLINAVLEHKEGYKKKQRGYFFIELRKIDDISIELK